jgi:hypothetical protein
VRGNALLVIVAAVVLLIAFVGHSPTTSPSGGAKISVNVVPPPILGVTMSPTSASCGNYSGGQSPRASTATALGFPNATCSVGVPGGAGSFPFKITNGTASSQIEIEASSAVPSDGGTQWILCRAGTSAPCTGPASQSGKLPGANQYMAENFALEKPLNQLTGTPACDPEFDVGTTAGCSASSRQSQTEGIEVIGPSSSKDNSQSWTITITWIAVSG